MVYVSREIFVRWLLPTWKVSREVNEKRICFARGICARIKTLHKLTSHPLQRGVDMFISLRNLLGLRLVEVHRARGREKETSVEPRGGGQKEREGKKKR